MLVSLGDEHENVFAVCGFRNAYGRPGIEPLSICQADRNRLDPEQQKEWGNYYDAHPQVMACNVPQKYFALKNNLNKT